MRFKVGDIVHNKITHEEGRVERIADLPECGLCYIVSMALDPIRDKTIEAIWKQSEVSD